MNRDETQLDSQINRRSVPKHRRDWQSSRHNKTTESVLKFIPIEHSEKNRLFQAYLEKREELRGFYDHFQEVPTPAILDHILRRERPRSSITTRLERHHQQWSAGSETMQNIQRLGQSNTLAVVTGQQAGTFGGPLYTLYKVMTAIRISERWARRYPHYQFVPIFWMEVDDSDFGEINHIHYIDKHNQLKALTLPEREDEQGRPISRRRLPHAIHHWFRQLEEDFYDTEFRQAVFHQYRRCYQPGRTYHDALACLLLTLFGSKGLVIFNPGDPHLKQLGQSVFETALRHAETISNRLLRRSQALERFGYQPQIQHHPHQTLVFYITENGRRLRIDRETSSGMVLKSPEGFETFPINRLLETLEKSPERFTPNVALRPLLQDFLLPTACYIAGPAEVAYFAQLQPLYHFFEIPMPIIHPRHRLTLVEAKIRKIVQKYHLSYSRIFESPQHLIGEVLKEQQPLHPAFQEFQAIPRSIEASFRKFEPSLKAFDPTLIKALHHTREAMHSHLQKFQRKLERALEQKHQIQVRQVDRLIVHLFPGHIPQERALNMIYFQIKYGWDFPEKLLNHLPPETRPHWVVEF